MEKIEFNDFLKVDLRVGQVISASAPTWSNKLLEFQVDFGAGIGEKTILSGVKQWYEPEFFVDKKFIFIINLPERKMGEAVSQGMMLMVDAEEKPTLIILPDEAVVGANLA